MTLTRADARRRLLARRTVNQKGQARNYRVTYEVDVRATDSLAACKRAALIYETTPSLGYFYAVEVDGKGEVVPRYVEQNGKVKRKPEVADSFETEEVVGR